MPTEKIFLTLVVHQSNSLDVFGIPNLFLFCLFSFFLFYFYMTTILQLGVSLTSNVLNICIIIILYSTCYLYFYYTRPLKFYALIVSFLQLLTSEVVVLQEKIKRKTMKK